MLSPLSHGFELGRRRQRGASLMANAGARQEAFRAYFADAGTRTLPTAMLGQDASDRLRPPLAPGLLIGITDRMGRDRGLGILIAVAPAGRELKLLTPIAEDIASLRPGELTLDADCRERRILRANQ